MDLSLFHDPAALISSYGPLAVLILLILPFMGEDIIIIPAGFLIGQGHLNPWETFICAYVGAFISDAMWYLACFHYGTRLLHKKWFKRMAHPRRLNIPGEDLPKVHHLFVEPYPYVRKDALVVGGGNSAAEAALFLSEEGARTTMAIWREDWENRDPKAGTMKHWVRKPLEQEIEAGRLRVILYKAIDEITPDEVRLTNDEGRTITLPNDVVFVLIGSDADLSLLKRLGVKTEAGKLTEVPVYDPETFETNIPGLYVAGHFTHARHIKEAIAVPRRIVPLIAESLRAGVAR